MTAEIYSLMANVKAESRKTFALAIYRSYCPEIQVFDTSNPPSETAISMSDAFFSNKYSVKTTVYRYYSSQCSH